MDVKTAGRTVEVFETFAELQKPLSLTELGRALNAPMSSCLYLVRALENRGYLYAVGSRRQIYPTRKLFDIAQAIAGGDSWIERVEPHLKALRDSTLETVILGKRQGNRVVYLAVFEGPQTIRYSSKVGDLKPLHASSIGKALLSAMTPSELQKLLKKLPLEPATPTTLTDPKALLADLERSKKRKYSLTRGEFVPDVMAVAKPVFLGSDQYAIAIAGPLYRMAGDVHSHVEKLFETSTLIEAQNRREATTVAADS
jgi:IclR family transcriptional regulator, acetate operon repressor